MKSLQSPLRRPLERAFLLERDVDVWDDVPIDNTVDTVSAPLYYLHDDLICQTTTIIYQTSSETSRKSRTGGRCQACLATMQPMDDRGRRRQ